MNDLQKQINQLQKEYDILDACIELQNEKLNAYKMSENEANEIIAELEAKNKRLKDKIKTIKTSRKIWELEALKQGCIKVVEVDKYKQTLQEIKVIAGREISLTAEGDELWDVFSEILQIITKAEEEWK